MTTLLEAYAEVTGADIIRHQQQLGDFLKAKEFVRENFLLTRQLREHLTLMVSLQHGETDRIELS